MRESKKDKRFMKRTVDIIVKGGIIVLKRGEWYLSCWTNIAGGMDSASWAARRHAQSFGDLKFAHALACLYGAKVVVVYPKKKAV